MNTPLDAFVTAAISHGRHTIEGDARRTNGAYRQLSHAREALRTSSDGGQGALLALLDHSEDSVRTWAAYFLLPSKPGAALATLDAIGSGQGLIAFDAVMTTKEWRAGRLRVS
jgi:hypothetical protein